MATSPLARWLSGEDLAALGHRAMVMSCFFPVSFLFPASFVWSTPHVLIANWIGDADKAIFCFSRLAEFYVHRLWFYRGSHEFSMK
jgi:hypothetical protein